jgi:hypothetical protein
MKFKANSGFSEIEGGFCGVLGFVLSEKAMRFCGKLAPSI